MRIATLLIGLVLAGSAVAVAQPAPPAPPATPPPQPKARTAAPPVVPPHMVNGKPIGVYLGDCLGSTVYVSSHEWRECCILCSVGDDSMSKGEVQEYEAYLKARAEAEQGRGPTVVNIDARQTQIQPTIHASAFGRPAALAVDAPPPSAPGKAGARQKGPPRPFISGERTAYDGLPGLKSRL